MAEANDIALLREFAGHNSETAFAELVRRHINPVYSVALRFTGNTGDAQDVTQAVFIILARKAAGLSARTVLTGWLYETTRFTASRLLRSRARRRAHEQEASMQSILDEPSSDAMWRQLAPYLEAAMSRLGERDRTLLALRYYEHKTSAEAAALLGIREEAARKRTNRALEKLRNFFAKRGVNSTTAVIAESISANSVLIAPATLAKTVTLTAMAKGATASTSTLTLIKGTLKLMAWTKAKAAVVTAIGILCVVGTTTVTIREIQKHKTYPWQGREGVITDNQLNQPPQVKIVPSKFHIADEYTGDKLLGTGLRIQDIVANAYDFSTPARAIFSVPLPTRRYDYIACLPGGQEVNEKALQAEVKRKFGIIARTETRDTDVWLLKVKFLNAHDLELDRGKNHGNGLFPDSKTGKFRGWNEPMAPLAATLEYFANFPVVNETGLTNRYDFELNCTEADLKNRDLDTLNQALDKLGLELVPTNMPIKMLVVEKAK